MSLCSIYIYIYLIFLTILCFTGFTYPRTKEINNEYYRKIRVEPQHKLYERLILNRIAPTVEEYLIKEQAGFRPGKSCTSQLLYLTQHIKDGYKVGNITGTTFVDLSAAYDTVNHRFLIQKLYNTTQGRKLCSVIQNLLSNRRFYVELNNECRRWRKQNNGRLQGSVLVLAPTLFNIYTNDQAIHYGTRSLLLLFAFQSMFISIWVSRLEIAEFPDSVRRSDGITVVG